jgi:hypothetical protein
MDVSGGSHADGPHVIPRKDLKGDDQEWLLRIVP